MRLSESRSEPKTRANMPSLRQLEFAFGLVGPRPCGDATARFAQRSGYRDGDLRAKARQLLLSLGAKRIADQTSRGMELPPENRSRPRGLSPENYFAEPASCRASRGDQSYVAARISPFSGAISFRAAADFTARSRMATGLPGLGNPGRKALPYPALSSAALCAAFHLSLPKLPARFPSRAKDQTPCGMSRVLPGPQRRSIRRTLSIETPQIVAAFVSNSGRSLRRALPKKARLSFYFF